MSKGPSRLPNCLRISETSIALNVFKGVICDVSAYTGIRYQKSYILVSDRMKQTKIQVNAMCLLKSIQCRIKVIISLLQNPIISYLIFVLYCSLYIK